MITITELWVQRSSNESRSGCSRWINLLNELITNSPQLLILPRLTRQSLLQRAYPKLRLEQLGLHSRQLHVHAGLDTLELRVGFLQLALGVLAEGFKTAVGVGELGLETGSIGFERLFMLQSAH